MPSCKLQWPRGYRGPSGIADGALRPMQAFWVRAITAIRWNRAISLASCFQPICLHRCRGGHCSWPHGCSQMHHSQAVSAQCRCARRLGAGAIPATGENHELRHTCCRPALASGTPLTLCFTRSWHPITRLFPGKAPPNRFRCRRRLPRSRK